MLVTALQLMAAMGNVMCLNKTTAERSQSLGGHAKLGVRKHPKISLDKK